MSSQMHDSPSNQDIMSQTLTVSLMEVDDDPRIMLKIVDQICIHFVLVVIGLTEVFWNAQRRDRRRICDMVCERLVIYH